LIRQDDSVLEREASTTTVGPLAEDPVISCDGDWRASELLCLANLEGAALQPEPAGVLDVNSNLVAQGGTQILVALSSVEYAREAFGPGRVIQVGDRNITLNGSDPYNSAVHLLRDAGVDVPDFLNPNVVSVGVNVTVIEVEGVASQYSNHGAGARTASGRTLGEVGNDAAALQYNFAHELIRLTGIPRHSLLNGRIQAALIERNGDRINIPVDISDTGSLHSAFQGQMVELLAGEDAGGATSRIREDGTLEIDLGDNLGGSRIIDMWDPNYAGTGDVSQVTLRLTLPGDGIQVRRALTPDEALGRLVTWVDRYQGAIAEKINP
jgi:hypothetical protein